MSYRLDSEKKENYQTETFWLHVELLTDPSGGGFIFSHCTDGPVSSRNLPNNSLKPLMFNNASCNKKRKCNLTNDDKMFII